MAETSQILAADIGADLQNILVGPTGLNNIANDLQLNNNLTAVNIGKKMKILATQEVILKNGVGLTDEEKYQIDPMNSSVCIVNRLTPFNSGISGLTILGGTTGGNSPNAPVGVYPSSAITPKTQGFPISVLYTYQNPINIPISITGLIDTNYLDSAMDTMKKEVARLMNATTTAEFMGSALNYAANNNVSIVRLKSQAMLAMQGLASSNPAIQAFIAVQNQLDKGDPQNFADYYQRTSRSFMFTNYLYAQFTASAIVFAPSNYAQDILRAGGISIDVKELDIENGYVGTYMGVHSFLVSDAVWQSAGQLLRNVNSAPPAGGLGYGTMQNIYGMGSAAEGNVRIIRPNEKIITNSVPTGFIGVQLLPWYNWGHSAIYPSANRLVVDTNFVNPATSGNNLIIDNSNTLVTTPVTITAMSVNGVAATVSGANINVTVPAAGLTLAQGVYYAFISSCTLSNAQAGFTTGNSACYYAIPLKSNTVASATTATVLAVPPGSLPESGPSNAAYNLTVTLS